MVTVHLSFTSARRFAAAALLLPLTLSVVPGAASAQEADDDLGGTWRRMASAPFGAADVAGGWTGTELVVADPKGKRRAAAYYPALDEWRPTARPPRRIDAGSPAYWTGTELVFVEPRGAAKHGLAAYDPVADSWRDTAPAPANEIAASTWAGDTLIAVSAAQLVTMSYDPITDSWTELSPFPSGAGAPRSLHWTGREVLALAASIADSDTVLADSEATLSFLPLDPGSGEWGEPSSGPLSASASDPLWTGRSFLFLTEPMDPDSAEFVASAESEEASPEPVERTTTADPALDGTYDPASDTWAVTENRCGIDTAESVWTDTLAIDLTARRAFHPATGGCHAVPLPPWTARSQARHAWTGTEVLEFSGSRQAGAKPRRDGFAYSPHGDSVLGVALDKGSRPVRIRVPSLGIDLPVISDQRPVKGSSPGYPACDVALYWSYFDLPGKPGTTWILAHAQQGMFLPLLLKVRADGAKSLLDRRIELQLRDGRLLTYRTYQVKPRSKSSDLRIGTKGRADGEQRLVLQTSTGVGSAPKLEVAARLVDVGTTDEPRPKAKPRACG